MASLKRLRSPSCYMRLRSGTGILALLCASPLVAAAGSLIDCDCDNGTTSGGMGPDAGSVISLDPTVWQGAVAQCNPPCVLVLPPSALSSSTTISIPPFTTSLEVGCTVTSITISATSIVTDQVPMSNILITPGANGTSLQPQPSIALQPLGIPLAVTSGESTTTTTRTITLPPWPAVTQGPVEGWGNYTTSTPNDTFSQPSSPPPDTATSTVSWDWITTTDEPFPLTSTSTTPSSTLPPWITDWQLRVEPVTTSVTSITPDPDGALVPCDLPFFSFCLDDPGLPKVLGWRWRYPPRPGIIGPGPPPLGVVQPPVEGFRVVPNEISWPKITIGPPPDYLPTFATTLEQPCVTTSASFCPVETELTIGSTVSTTYWNDVSTCMTYTACWATDSTPSTTGCALPSNLVPRAYYTDAPSLATVSPPLQTQDTTQTVEEPFNESVHAKSVTPSSMPFEQIAKASSRKKLVNSSESNEGSNYRTLSPRVDCTDILNYVCYPHSATDDAMNARIRAYLTQKGWDWVEVRSNAAHYTAYYHVSAMAWENFKVIFSELWEIRTCQTYSENDADFQEDAYSEDTPQPSKARVSSATPEASDEPFDVTSSLGNSSQIQKRVPSLPHYEVNSYCQLGHLSSPSSTWITDEMAVLEWTSTRFGPRPERCRYWRDESLGEGQTIYILDGEGFSLPDHNVFKDLSNPVIVLTGWDYGPGTWNNGLHGSQVGAIAAGQYCGVSPRAQLVFTSVKSPADRFIYPAFRFLEHLVLILEDLAANPSRQNGQSALVLSFALRAWEGVTEMFELAKDLLVRMIRDYGVVVTLAAGNCWPEKSLDTQNIAVFARQAGPLSNIIISGASDWSGRPSNWSEHWSDMSPTLVYGPDMDLWTPTDHGPQSFIRRAGTSFVAPQVAGLAAYLRALETPWKQQLRDPLAVKNLIMGLARRRAPGPVGTIYNGQDYWGSCLQPPFGRPGCPVIPDDLISNSCSGYAKRAEDTDCWGVYPSNSGGDGGDQGLGALQPDSIAWLPGEAGPICSSLNIRDIPEGPPSVNPQHNPRSSDACGTLCEGFFCGTVPQGHGPSFSDPANKNSSNVTVTVSVGPSTTAILPFTTISLSQPISVSSSSQSLPVTTQSPWTTLSLLPPSASTSSSTKTTSSSTSSSATSLTTSSLPVMKTITSVLPPASTVSSTTTSELPPPSPSVHPCVDIHCEFIHFETSGYDSDRVWVQVYENNQEVCNANGPLGMAITGSTPVPGMVGGCSQGYNLNVTGECASYTFSNVAEDYTTSFSGIRTDDYTDDCECRMYAEGEIKDCTNSYAEYCRVHEVCATNESCQQTCQLCGQASCSRS